MQFQEQVEIFFAVEWKEYFVIQIVRRVSEDLGNTYRTAAAFVFEQVFPKITRQPIYFSCVTQR